MVPTRSWWRASGLPHPENNTSFRRHGTKGTFLMAFARGGESSLGPMATYTPGTSTVASGTVQVSTPPREVQKKKTLVAGQSRAQWDAKGGCTEKARGTKEDGDEVSALETGARPGRMATSTMASRGTRKSQNPGSQNPGKRQSQPIDSRATLICFRRGGVYNGTFVDGHKEGEGEMRFNHGTQQRPLGWSSLRSPSGRLTYEGATYQGGWRQGRFHGHGVYRAADGSRYEGDWEAGERNGHGVQVHPSGEKYSGDWLQNLKHGKGVLRWSNGKSRMGEWNNGKVIRWLSEVTFGDISKKPKLPRVKS
eukprot:scaffold3319_cov258-Pinguiococcus_pyrenoidosus.AAC.3